MMVGGGDGLNAPRFVWAHPPRQPDARANADRASLPVWLLLFAVLAFGFYFAWCKSEDRRIALGDLTERERLEAWGRRVQNEGR